MKALIILIVCCLPFISTAAHNQVNIKNNSDAITLSVSPKRPPVTTSLFKKSRLKVAFNSLTSGPIRLTKKDTRSEGDKYYGYLFGLFINPSMYPEALV